MPCHDGKKESCPLFGKCTKSECGRVIKVYDKWEDIYNNRTCTERINNRILNDYVLHKMNIRNGFKSQIFSRIAGICMHMDAWAKTAGI